MVALFFDVVPKELTFSFWWVGIHIATQPFWQVLSLPCVVDEKIFGLRVASEGYVLC